MTKRDENEKREEGCSYCNKRQIIVKYGASVYIDEDKIALTDTQATAYKKIAYCPMCGRKLGE